MNDSIKYIFLSGSRMGKVFAKLEEINLLSC